MSDPTKMFVILVTVYFATVHSFSIGGVKDRIIKRETDLSDVFPDFDNQYRYRSLGDSIGAKKKPVKRLALPVSFLLRSVAEGDGEDYYLSQAGGENGDNYEDKDWSDTNRSPLDIIPLAINNTNLTDIEGIAHNIKNTNEENENKSMEKLKLTLNQIIRNKLKTDKSDENINSKGDEAVKPKLLSRRLTETMFSAEDGDEYAESTTTEKPKTTSSEEEEKPVVTEQAEKEKAEAEEKKRKILEAVDKLKERHEAEQRRISEKQKEEEFFFAERERNKMFANENRDVDKYSSKVKKVSLPEYEDYLDANPAEDKYKILTMTKSTTTTTTTTERATPRTTRRQTEKEPESTTGKMTVFKNPRLFMIDYDSGNDGTSTKKTIDLKGSTTKYSSKYKPRTAGDGKERIELVPIGEEAKDGEPVLFFPKRRKSKTKNAKPSTPEHDSTVAETVTEPPTNTNVITSPSAVDSGVDGVISDSNVFTPATAPTGPSAITGPLADDKYRLPDQVISSDDELTVQGISAPVVTAADTSGVAAKPSTADVTAPTVYQASSAIDAEPAQSYKEEAKKPEDYEHHQGGHHSHHSEHEKSFGEEGKKAYEGYHENAKTKKGHHDKESHSGEYQDAAGYDKEHHKETDHFGAHLHEEHGKKHAEYEESGKHSKGHSTKGSHDIHKKEEYEKKVEFFEEDGDSGEEIKAGGHHQKKEHSKGGKFHKGNLESEHQIHEKGDSAKFDKGGHGHDLKGRKSSAGHDGHHKHQSRHRSAASGQKGKKWVYHHGYPAKSANLVVIDRRLD